MGEVNWEEERKELLERLQKAEQVAAESQAEAAMYWDILEDWHKVAKEALAQNDISLLQELNRRWIPFFLPDRNEGKHWGKLFLVAYMRDAKWLENTKKALEQIKADAEKFPNTYLTEKILTFVEEGLHDPSKKEEK